MPQAPARGTIAQAAYNVNDALVRGVNAGADFAGVTRPGVAWEGVKQNVSAGINRAANTDLGVRTVNTGNRIAGSLPGRAFSVGRAAYTAPITVGGRRAPGLTKGNAALLGLGVVAVAGDDLAGTMDRAYDRMLPGSLSDRVEALKYVPTAQFMSPDWWREAAFLSTQGFEKTEELMQGAAGYIPNDTVRNRVYDVLDGGILGEAQLLSGALEASAGLAAMDPGRAWDSLKQGGSGAVARWNEQLREGNKFKNDFTNDDYRAMLVTYTDLLKNHTDERGNLTVWPDEHGIHPSFFASGVWVDYANGDGDIARNQATVEQDTPGLEQFRRDFNFETPDYSADQAFKGHSILGDVTGYITEKAFAEGNEQKAFETQQYSSFLTWLDDRKKGVVAPVPLNVADSYAARAAYVASGLNDATVNAQLGWGQKELFQARQDMERAQRSNQAVSADVIDEAVRMQKLDRNNAILASQHAQQGAWNDFRGDINALNNRKNELLRIAADQPMTPEQKAEFDSVSAELEGYLIAPHSGSGAVTALSKDYRALADEYNNLIASAGGRPLTSEQIIQAEIIKGKIDMVNNRYDSLLQQTQDQIDTVNGYGMADAGSFDTKNTSGFINGGRPLQQRESTSLQRERPTHQIAAQQQADAFSVQGAGEFQAIPATPSHPLAQAQTKPPATTVEESAVKLTPTQVAFQRAEQEKAAREKQFADQQAAQERTSEAAKIATAQAAQKKADDERTTKAAAAAAAQAQADKQRAALRSTTQATKKTTTRTATTGGGHPTNQTASTQKLLDHIVNLNKTPSTKTTAAAADTTTTATPNRFTSPAAITTTSQYGAADAGSLGVSANVKTSTGGAGSFPSFFY